MITTSTVFQSDDHVLRRCIFYIAFINKLDQYHRGVMKFASNFQGDVITTQWVWTEVADALAASHCRRYLQEAFCEFTSDLRTRIVEASPEHFRAGMELYHARRDKGWSLTDCISFTIMEREDIREAITGDHHFAQAGFIPLFAK